MNTVRIAAALLLACAVAVNPSAFAAIPTNVDRVAGALDTLSAVSYDTWKVSPDLKVAGTLGLAPTRPGFDDAAWDVLMLGQQIYPDTCWIRKEIVLPPSILGTPVGGVVRFAVTVDDYGSLWVNGERKGDFPWDGEFDIADHAKPGDKFLIAIKAVNTGGPLRLLRAQLQTDAARPVQAAIRDFALSLRVGQKLLSFDTYQTNARQKEDPGTDKSTLPRTDKERLGALLQALAGRVDVDALRRGDVNRYKASVDAVRGELAPIRDFARQYTLFFDANAHIDAAWLWREKETIEVCKNTFSSVFTMMQQRPDFTYTQSSAAYYDWMERLYPEIFAKIQARVKDGRWEVVGGMWVEPDCNLPGGESWSRHLLYAKKYFQQKLGADVRIGWNPDSFGYNGNMPMFYRNAGIDAFITQKIGWNETNVFPHRLFWWESPDGSRILSYFPFDYVNTVEDPFSLVDWTRQFEANTGFRKMLILFGVGDHGGGPSLAMLDRIDRLRTLDIYPAIEYGTATTYLTWLKTQDLSSLPTWKDELYLEYHQGTYTTQAHTKLNNRSNEVLLTDAEKFSTLATLTGRAYNGADLRDAWKILLFNQFHDILPGSGIREVYIDATEEHETVRAIGSHELSDALGTIAATVNTNAAAKGKPVLVFNPLSWERSDIVRATLEPGDTARYAVFDAAGKEIPSQIVVNGKYERDVLFVARNVPSLGYATYLLRAVAGASASPVPHDPPWRLESRTFRVTVDEKSGWVTSIVDKENGREILSGPANELQLLEDLPKAWDAWNIGWTGVVFPSAFRQASVVERGPVRTVVRLVRDYLKPGVKKDFPTENFPSTFFTQDIILYNDLDRIDFVTDVDWWEDKTMLKVAFPLANADSVATYEIPYGSITRSTRMTTSWEKAKVEVPAERWVDVSSGGYGVSLLNNSKYGFDVKGNVIRMSLLRSPKWPDLTADRGKHTIAYALYPHRGSWKEAGTVRRGYEFNVPLRTVITGRHTGTLPMSHSFVRVTPSNVVLTTIKKAEDSDAWVMQMYECEGKDAEATVEMPAAPTAAVRSSFLEDDGTPLPVRQRTIAVPVSKHGVVTIKGTLR
jgi:alpha-mannosidase